MQNCLSTLVGDLRTTMSLYFEQQLDLREEMNRVLLPTIDLTMETAVLLTKIYKNGFTVDPVALKDVQEEFEKEKQSANQGSWTHKCCT
jgi:DNA polymerase I-like protein with 3'-5' exonuclease and polymerase domains